MLYGSTMELMERPNIKQPCCFFVFSDGIVAIRPPVGTITIGMNEANNVRAMGMVCVHGLKLTNDMPDIGAAAFAQAMSTISDGSGKTVQAELIAKADITGAELAKNGLLGAKVTLRTGGKVLVLVGSKKVVKEFGSYLAKLLGERFTTLLK